VNVLLRRVLPRPVRAVLRALILSRPCRAILHFASVTRHGGLPLSFRVALSSRYTIVYCWDPGRLNNFGDALNPILVEALSGKRVVNSCGIVNLARKPVYYAIGSVLPAVNTTSAVVWGSGFMDSSDRLAVIPRKVLAVRGPLTRDKLLRQGVECPEVYGDPALLCPILFEPSDAKRYSVGLVPHYVDRDSPLLRGLRAAPGVSVIDLTGGVEDVVRGITECEVIASSSLHGLIIADAYGIPSIWVRISGKLKGDDFKFRDYFLSVGRQDTSPMQITGDSALGDLLSSAKHYRASIDLEKLLRACPFAAAGRPARV